MVFEYGMLSVGYSQQDPRGKFGPFVIKGWDSTANRPK